MKIKLGPSVVAILLKGDQPYKPKVNLVKSRTGAVPKKKVKLANRIWYFFKCDLDPFPSKLHGHDYKNNQILDAFTGNIYDSTTHKLIKKLTKNQKLELNKILAPVIIKWKNKENDSEIN